VARAFNLTAEELQSRVLARWAAGEAIEFEDRRWEPGRAKLTIYEARALAGEEMGLGRGWGTVTRDGEDVTERLLSAVQPAAVPDFKQRLLAELAGGPLPLGRIVELAGEPGRRASERLAVAEQAVWELAHEGRIHLLEHGRQVPPERWQALLLRWDAWASGAVSVQRNEH
jgi:hypothetical protein